MPIDGIINEPTINFVGKDGFYWWVGEVEDNEDPMELGRVKVRVLGYYTNVRGGTTADLPTEALPWATVLQHTSQPGNDGQGESSGQLQPGAIVMGFFMDGENAQMPIVMGVMRVNKSLETSDKNVFAFTGETMEPGSTGHVNPVLYNPADPTYSVVNERGSQGNKARGGENNSVPIPGNTKTAKVAGIGAPGTGVGNKVSGSSGNPFKPITVTNPIPAANGVGGPWKTLEYQLSYLVEDLASHAGNLVKAEDGDFLNIVTGKLVSAKALMAKIQNFLGAVFAQIVAAIRQQISALAEQLELVNLLGKIGAGIPLALTTAIQTAVVAILKALCVVDNQLIGMVQDPIGAITNQLNSFLDGLIDKAAMVVQGVQEIIDSVVCSVQSVLSTMLSVVDTVKTIVQGFDQATAIIDAWQKGSEIFAEGFDGLVNGITSLTGLIQLFIKFIPTGCGRSADGGKDTVGWYPLYGVTHCTPEELESINKILGIDRGRKSCGDAFGAGSLVDSIIEKADPYLVSAKTFLDGAYELHVGTPGRQASVTKSASGTTRTSINSNQTAAGDYEARKQAREKNPDISAEDLEAAVSKYKKDTNSGKGNTGSLVADDVAYAGNLTASVAGDDCKVVDNDYVRTINGDYFLKVTGNCHLEVGGGFFLSAEGAPRLVDKNGEANKSGQKIQKHTMRFGSDVDLNVSGARLNMQSAEMDIHANKHQISGAVMDNSCSKQTYAAGELTLAGDSTINMSTTHLTQLINTPPNPLAAKVGITTVCAGSIITTQIPGALNGVDTVPTNSIIIAAGTITRQCGAGGYNLNVAAGAYVCNVATGAWSTTVAAGAVTLTATAGAMALTATAGIMQLTALTIKLN
ncbi:baseplate hub subunit and tail lysozyme [Cyanophage S-RIM12_W1_12_0610]|uniref:Baseplate hub subunit and tail lysozyme n=1 Tax=Cyanophage S-RIM12 TaxID=1278402 RepID=A0A1D7SYK1_9CAUD|nr:baseplate hub subunit and tail lysozyme [Cyanophage S-RIM12_W1_12_0610]